MMSDTDRILFQVNPEEYPYADFDYGKKLAYNVFGLGEVAEPELK